MADLDGPYDVPCGDGDDAAAADNTDQEAATSDADLILPPLPPPLKTRNLEFCCGATTILTCVVIAAGVAVAVIFAPSSNLSPATVGGASRRRRGTKPIVEPFVPGHTLRRSYTHEGGINGAQPGITVLPQNKTGHRLQRRNGGQALQCRGQGGPDVLSSKSHVAALARPA